VDQFPEVISPISDGYPLHVWQWWKASTCDGIFTKTIPNKVKVTNTKNRTPQITIKIFSEGIEYEIPFDLAQLKIVRGCSMHQLFVKKKADALNSSASHDQKRNLRKLCKKYNVLTSLTSFILIEQRKNCSESTPKLVSIPLARPKPPPLSAQTLAKSGTVSLHGTFSSHYKATIGADFHTCTLQLADRKVNVQLWDLGA